jgi:hypothetical protein
LVDSALTAAGGLTNTQLLAALGTLYSGNNTAEAIKAATDKLIAGNASAQATVKGYLDPFVEAGKPALARYQAGVAPGGEFARSFTMADAQNSDAMRFAAQGGQDLIQNSAAMRGGLLGSNTLTGLTKFGQANAAQYQNQAFNQYMTNREAERTALGTMMAQGYNASNQASGDISDLQTATANAGASSTMSLAQNQSRMIDNIISGMGATGGTAGGAGSVPAAVVNWLRGLTTPAGSAGSGSAGSGSAGSSVNTGIVTNPSTTTGTGQVNTGTTGGNPAGAENLGVLNSQNGVNVNTGAVTNPYTTMLPGANTGTAGGSPADATNLGEMNPLQLRNTDTLGGSNSNTGGSLSMSDYDPNTSLTLNNGGDTLSMGMEDDTLNRVGGMQIRNWWED